MKLVHKIMDCQLSGIDEQARTFWAVASTEKIDRQGDLIDAAGWDFSNFRQNPVIAWAHDYSQPPVAKALELRVDDGRLLFLAQFPTAEEYAFADTIWRLYKGGYMRAFSVGFAPLDSRLESRMIDGRAVTGNHYLKQELYEISCVTLPANPDALVSLGAKANQQRKPLGRDHGAAIAGQLGGLMDRLVAGSLARRLAN